MKLVWEELMVSLVVKEFPAMYVTRCFITMWTKNSCRPVCCHIKAVRNAEECVDIWSSVLSQSAFLQWVLSPRRNIKAYNITGYLRPRILIAGSSIFASLFLHLQICIMAPQERALGQPTPYLPRARTIFLVACVPVFPHMHVALSFAGNVCGGNNRMTLLWKNAWGSWCMGDEYNT